MFKCFNLSDIMKLALIVVVAFVAISFVNGDDDDDKKPKKLQIGVKKRMDVCHMKSKKGDTLIMQYRVGLIKIHLTFYTFNLYQYLKTKTVIFMIHLHTFLLSFFPHE